MPTPADFKVGDTWEWRRIDDHTKLEEGKQSRTVIIDTDGVKKFRSESGATGQISNAFLGNSSNKKPWRVWPLEVGKTWDREADGKTPEGRDSHVQQEVKVAAYEEVIVPAGTYMAFKIEHNGWIQSTTSAGRPSRGVRNETYWYAPSLKADVKRIFSSAHDKFTQELTSFKPGTP